MARAKEQTPLAVPSSAYERDTAAWAFEQADLLRRGRYAELDRANVIEELESLGNEQRHALESSYRLLISHLLKWRFQPERRSASWEATILRERFHVSRREARNPSLRTAAARIVEDIYPSALREAMIETGLPRSAFPAACPFSLDQLRDDDFLPESPAS